MAFSKWHWHRDMKVLFTNSYCFQGHSSDDEPKDLELQDIPTNGDIESAAEPPRLAF